MRIFPGMAKGDKFITHRWLMPALAISSKLEFSGVDAIVKICGHLLIPSAFVSGQRTR